MARKRMISPEIWTSQDFSELSNFEKIVFISLFSHADDEGRGVAEASFISSMTFPFEKNRRDADIEKALQKIALKMSVQFYLVKGRKYYVMTSWKRWQKIDKPSKSKLPPPPSVGEGGGILETENFDEYSSNGSRTLDELSSNEIENNIIENKVSKKVSNKKENLLSYDEIFENFCTPSELKDAVIEFIRHLKVSFGLTMLNDRLENMLIKLDFAYGKDDSAKCHEVRRAITNGYKRLECEGDI